MTGEARRDTLVAFLPSRLNRQPVIVRGLTADELWITVALSAATGLLVGIPLAVVARSFATAPALVVAGVAIGVFIGGGIIRKFKRGRPDTWLYRALEWQLTLRFPAFAARLKLGPLITRSGRWTVRRSWP